ncbi:MAG: hypothetical protein JXA82_17610 [Sedimentisphaerales bacterium]|nr:hypothetical protein [Sedimentisphaerales bacterium]
MSKIKEISPFLIFGCIALIISCEAFGTAVELVPQVPASEYHLLSTQKKTEILTTITEGAFITLLEVSHVGLENSAPALEWIVKARTWLEETQDVQARTLSLMLQYGVDSAILNELWRAEQVRVSEKPCVPFVENSLNRKTCMEILKQNRIDENEQIAFALSLKTPIGELTREKDLLPTDFLNGSVFKEHGKELTIGTIRSRMKGPNGQEQEFELVSKDKRLEAIKVPAILLFAKAIDSQEKLTKLFLPILLDAIQNARDARLVINLYWDGGGFADAESGDQEQPRHINNRSISVRMEKLVTSGSAKRLVQRNKSDILITMELMHQLNERVDIYEDCHTYLGGLAIRLRLFMRKLELIPEEYRETIRHGGIGLWLELPEKAGQ